MKLLVIPSIMTKDWGHINALLAVLAILYACVFASVLIDLYFGIKRAKRLNTLRTSFGYRRTCSCFPLPTLRQASCSQCPTLPSSVPSALSSLRQSQYLKTLNSKKKAWRTSKKHSINSLKTGRKYKPLFHL